MTPSPLLWVTFLFIKVTDSLSGRDWDVMYGLPLCNILPTLNANLI
jgi:hypothetical protein